VLHLARITEARGWNDKSLMSEGKKESSSYVVNTLNHLSSRIFIPNFLRALISVCHHLHQSHCYEGALAAGFGVQVHATVATLAARISIITLRLERMNNLNIPLYRPFSVRIRDNRLDERSYCRRVEQGEVIVETRPI